MADNTNNNINSGNSALIAAINHYYGKNYIYSQTLRTQSGYTDCSALVYTGLKEGGFNVPSNTFTTSQLFNGSGSTLTQYAQNNFDYIDQDDARHVGTLQAGDILMW